MSGTSPAEPGREAIERALDHHFRDPALLDVALTHPSLAHEEALASNERLELLGDAVIGLVVTDLLYRAHPDWDEGALTQARLALVNRRTLAQHARALALGEHVRLGRTERRSNGAAKESVLGDLFEAVIGAMFLDAGLDPVRALARRLFAEALLPGVAPPERDVKARLQERAQIRLRELPVYRVVSDSGRDDDPERFFVEVAIAGVHRGQGAARTKREAERRAAHEALAGWTDDE